jgi:hypothetical protein
MLVTVNQSTRRQLSTLKRNRWNTVVLQGSFNLCV